METVLRGPEHKAQFFLPDGLFQGLDILAHIH